MELEKAKQTLIELQKLKETFLSVGATNEEALGLALMGLKNNDPKMNVYYRDLKSLTGAIPYRFQGEKILISAFEKAPWEKGFQIKIGLLVSPQEGNVYIPVKLKQQKALFFLSLLLLKLRKTDQDITGGFSESEIDEMENNILKKLENADFDAQQSLSDIQNGLRVNFKDTSLENIIEKESGHFRISLAPHNFGFKNTKVREKFENFTDFSMRNFSEKYSLVYEK